MTTVLTASQLKQVWQAASLLPPAERDTFWHSIRNQLRAVPHPTDAQVHGACQDVLGVGRSISAPVKGVTP
jgi:hypothetical protein